MMRFLNVIGFFVLFLFQGLSPEQEFFSFIVVILGIVLLIIILIYILLTSKEE